MFGKKRDAASTPVSTEIGLLGAGTRFRGTIRFKGTLRLDGEVVGDIRSDQGSGSILVINHTATVAGSVVSDSVIISGRVEGDILAQRQVEILRGGTLKGNIYTDEITIEAGASFQGQCHMIRDLDEDELRVLAEKYTSDPAQAPAPGLADSDGEPLGERYSA